MMEFEFKRTFGEYSVQCSMGFEIVGRWLHEEIGRDLDKLAEFINCLDRVSLDQSQVYTRIGTEITLTIEAGEVLIEENALKQYQEHDLEPDMDFYDSESSAICGLEDFTTLIHQWQRFLTTGR